MKKIKKEDINIQLFNCFNVYSVNNDYSFIHIEIEDKPSFYEKIFDYYFSEDKLIQYCEHMTATHFEPSTKHYVILYKHLKTYIDDFNLEIEISDLEEILIKVFTEEQSLEIKKGKNIVRLDKMGKIGEYIFCCILSDFFHFDCIIPKVHLQTDYNMNVYGIDTLFFCEEQSLLLFGESKLCKNIDNGICLIKRSLSEYERQISDEFEIVLSNRLYKEKLKKFKDVFGDFAEISIDLKQFIEKAKIRQIGIPIFIAHGEETEPTHILGKISSLPKHKIFGLDTIYYSISLPIINKNKLIATFTKKIREKEDYYKNEANK